MPKRDYKQFCPTARALNVVGERWTLLIVRDLMQSPRRYSELRRSLPGMASNLLAVRLSEMEEAGLVVKQHIDDPSPRDVYALTERGRELEPVLLELGRFGFPFLDAPTEEQPMIADLVPLGLRAMIHDPELPDDAFAIRFALQEGDYLLTIGPQFGPGERVLPSQRISVDPVPSDTATAADVTVSGTVVGLLWIRQGLIDLAQATADGMLEILGDEDAEQLLRYLYRLETVAA